MMPQGKHKLYNPGENHRANACVGFNGGRYGFGEYGWGYLLAAKVICENVAEGGELMDLKIYPALFNLRHGIELYLKDFLLSLPPIFDEEAKLHTTHNLSALFGHLKPFILRHKGYFDESGECLAYIDYSIKGIEELDATSMAFRYPVDKSEDPHIEGKASHINYAEVHKMVIKLLEIFDWWGNVRSELNEGKAMAWAEYGRDSY